MKNFTAIPELAQELLVASSHGIESLIQKLSVAISHPVIITDPVYQILLSSDSTFEIEKETVLPVLELETNNETNTVVYQVSTMDNDKVGLATPIFHNHSTLGYLFIIGTETPSELHMFSQILNFAAALSGIQMQKKLEVRQERVKFKDSFLFDMLYGNFKQKEDIVEYGKIWDWDFTHAHQAIVFSLVQFNQFSEEDRQILKTLYRFIEKMIIDQNKRPIAMMKQNQIIVLYSTENLIDANRKDNLNTLILSIFNKMETLQSEHQVACGIGKVYDNPVELFRSFQEAKVAYDLGILLDIPIPYFSDLGLERILYKHDLQDLKEYYDHTLGELEKYDESNDGDLIDTLEAFAANQFDITKTSKALFLHRNTLRYRLKRIEEILNIKLDDFNIKLDISAAFKIKQLRKF